MRYLIIEDELPAQRLMESIVKELRPDWEASACLDSVESAVSWLKMNPHPEVIFMDIQLSDGLSFDILEQVEIEGMIIFTTAYDEYALRAFKLNSLDYLLKPLKKSELEKALEKYEHYTKQMFRSRNKLIDVAELLRAIKEAKPQYRTRFLISQGEVFFPLSLERVAYMYSSHRITSSVTFEGKRHIVDLTLDRLEEQLDPEQFFRVNRQFIVNINAVAKVHTFFNGKLILETEPKYVEKLTISREKARQFKMWLDG
ncbi:MAG: response regulator transcription factor [bacterium]|nr:response regulator transcription factor [bacterium]